MSLLNPGVRVVGIKGSNGVVSGQKVVAASATPEALDADQACNAVVVQAKAGNAGSVYLGGATGQHIELEVRQSISIGVGNANLVYVAVDNNGDGVNWLAVL